MARRTRLGWQLIDAHRQVVIWFSYAADGVQLHEELAEAF